jgi:hypothetical protein
MKKAFLDAVKTMGAGGKENTVEEDVPKAGEGFDEGETKA